MSLSILRHKFLLDENVRRELYTLLHDEGYDVRLAPKSSTDATLAKISKTERCVLITNDADFANYSQDRIFSVVWLRIRQSDHASLLHSFARLLQEISQFEAKLIVLSENGWDEYPLGEDLR